jgi:ornithine cyclodeaminase
MEVLTDNDIARIPIGAFIEPIADFVVEDFAGKIVAPPRHSVGFHAGKIVFTTGGNDRLAGFRAYESFASHQRIAEQQLVAAWDTHTCALKGVHIGTRLGAIRTGALGAIAVATLAPASATICALIGTGLQAETQLLGILARRPLAQVRVYSRHKANLEAFVSRMRALTPVGMIACDTAEDAAAHADIAILATNATIPVIDPAALCGVAHITTVGPKFLDSHELPLEAVADRLLVSDSPQQIRDQGVRHMLRGHPRSGDIEHLGESLIHGRSDGLRQSLYLSAGLAGTEVVALDTALSYLAAHR